MTSANRSIVLTAVALGVAATFLPVSAATLDHTEAPRVTHAAPRGGVSVKLEDLQAPGGQGLERPRGEDAGRPRSTVVR
jgi:hypothetical protein